MNRNDKNMVKSPCSHRPDASVQSLCTRCMAQRQSVLSRVRVRTSRPPAQKPGTITLQSSQTKALHEILDHLQQWTDRADTEGPGRALSSLRRLLGAPLHMAMEEIQEVDRPGGRARRRG